MRRSIFILLVTAIVGCSPANNPEPLDECAQMCEHGRDTLGGCEFSMPADSGAKCEEICRNSRANGRVWDSVCILDATSCSVADEC